MDAPLDDGAAKEHRVRLLVSGRVQGVGFRYFVEREASRAGVAGWVRNLSDGRVELEAVGALETLRRLVEAVRRGPSHARVTAVDERWDATDAPGIGFRIRHDEAP